MANIVGELLSKMNLRQFRCAETEKFPHVTFFFNDYREPPFPGEDRQIIPSPQVSTYDLQPEMSAYAVCDEMVKRIDSGLYGKLAAEHGVQDIRGDDKDVTKRVITWECGSLVQTSILNSSRRFTMMRWSI